MEIVQWYKASLTLSLLETGPQHDIWSPEPARNDP